ncbi:Oidioi.mRNA.OKI2018_I69.chr1.g1616.t1.cds [Oikopleura dioica]|uniref:Oidioi.mRNA.OKI2018_I69.chr1.g1616.t1.cds n=1 Tax=Oikopleura dioica TaxID=34765 RepID=A0ABN7SNZ3_OIKDI|nr:Oidioi.mRNA.OKI2018_I69.chr1.g1616.t1.cds [Oikopleura dioica]
MNSRQDDNDPYPYQIDEKARDEKMWKLVIPARKRLEGMKTQKSALLEKHDDLKDACILKYYKSYRVAAEREKCPYKEKYANIEDENLQLSEKFLDSKNVTWSAMNKELITVRINDFHFAPKVRKLQPIRSERHIAVLHGLHAQTNADIQSVFESSDQTGTLNQILFERMRIHRVFDSVKTKENSKPARMRRVRFPDAQTETFEQHNTRKRDYTDMRANHTLKNYHLHFKEISEIFSAERGQKRDFSKFKYPGKPSSHSETTFFNSKKELLDGFRGGRGIPDMKFGRFSDLTSKSQDSVARDRQILSDLLRDAGAKNSNFQLSAADRQAVNERKQWENSQRLKREKEHRNNHQW